MDLTARDELILKHRKLALWCANRIWRGYAVRSVEVQELCSEAMFALVKAGHMHAQRVSNGTDPGTFTTYARAFIEGSLKQFVDSLRGGAGYNERVRDGAELSIRRVSLTFTKDGEEYERHIPDPSSSPEVILTLPESESWTPLTQIPFVVGAGLTPKQLSVVEKRVDGMTLEEIGADLGVTRQAVSLIALRAYAALRASSLRMQAR